MKIILLIILLAFEIGIANGVNSVETPRGQYRASRRDYARLSGRVCRSGLNKYNTHKYAGRKPRYDRDYMATYRIYGVDAIEVTNFDTHTTYTDAFDASEELDEDNQWSGIMDSAREMARGGYAAAETAAVAVLNNGFSGGSTGTDDGQLFESTHDLINSGSTGDNADTTALGVDGLKAVYTLADRIVNEANIYVPVEYSCLVVPPELRQVAYELMDSTLTPQNSNNAVNIYKNRINKIVVNPYLSSTTAWFLASPGLKKKGRFYWRVKPQFKPGSDQYSGNFLYKARERLSVGHTDWQGIIGSTGAV